MAIINVVELFLFISLIVLIKMVMELSHLKKEIEGSARKLNILFKQNVQINESSGETSDPTENAITQQINEHNTFVLKYNKLHKFLPFFFLLT